MCDYSLEHYQSRPARQGETFTLSRFSSGSLGFIAKDSPSVAVCLACDMRLRLQALPEHIQARYSVSSEAPATFTQVDGGFYRDAVRFDNGHVVLLQELGPGVIAALDDALSQPLPVRERGVETVV